MKKIYSIFIILFILSSCFNNQDNIENINKNFNNNIDSGIIINDDKELNDDSEFNNTTLLDNEIQKQEQISQEIDEISEIEIDELINTIIE